MGRLPTHITRHAPTTLTSSVSNAAAIFDRHVSTTEVSASVGEDIHLVDADGAAARRKGADADDVRPLRLMLFMPPMPRAAASRRDAPTVERAANDRTEGASMAAMRRRSRHLLISYSSRKRIGRKI